ncbi:hypothetical protein GLW08_05045 [Pontibacillus yanchengensis]|uniref:Permease n=2 Tax=Pontibacillus yanchengensis TaxID=462910 RepID=A0A6I5A1Y0_9BACI|nr:hypothetical protein [Pontibacillus yanchengensis]MYL32121.1 hypothetical protein [Pontibacillus yanchengensis]MYL52701.1 hypothetical protein [Pontibacillus yanchengensis]
MSVGMLVSIFIIVLLWAIVMITILRYKEKISIMTGMVISMTIGMIIGVTLGAIIALHLHTDMFLSTFIGMGIGISAGVLAGIPIHMVAVMDGMVSGAMGGMMGAMLGAMIMPEYGDVTIRLLLLFYSVSTCILLYLLDYEIGDTGKKLFHNPIIMSVALGVFFYAYQMLGPIL